MLFIPNALQFRENSSFFLMAYTVEVVNFDCHAEDGFKFMDKYLDTAEGMPRHLALVFIR
jgi:hypothetical protein